MQAAARSGSLALSRAGAATVTPFARSAFSTAPPRAGAGATPPPSMAAAAASTKRPDYLLNFSNYSTAREALHYSTYALAAGIPAALLLGPPSTC